MDVNCFDCFRSDWMSKTYFVGERAFCSECYRRRTDRTLDQFRDAMQKEGAELVRECKDKGLDENN